MKGLIWFRQDLRLADNPAIISLSKQCKQAMMVFVINPDWFKTNAFHVKHMGFFREIFLSQTLRELDLDLKKYNQRLVVKVGDPLKIIPDLCKKHDIDLVTLTEHSDIEARRQVDNLKQYTPATVRTCDSHTLFLRYQLGFDKHDFPSRLDVFCEHVTKNNILPCIPISAPDSLPKRIKEDSDEWRSENFFHPLPFYHGGEDAGFMRLKEFFWKTKGLQHYKQLNRDIEGIHTHSRFSAWLSNGCLSVRSVAAELDKYEYRHGKDESSVDLYKKLLTREYHHWKQNMLSDTLLTFDEFQQIVPKEGELERFKAWQQGKTAFPLVNACMNQLNHVGYISSTARKIVASCLVNELNVHWRYGAAYFEQQLIDFDSAINFDSWQKLVKSSNSKHQTRYFDLEQCACEYDPEGLFVDKWLSVTDKALQG